MMKYEMIIFDLDGTLWETEKISYKTANAVLKKYEPNKEITMEVVKSTMGCTFAQTAEMYMPYYDVEKREKILGEMLDLNAIILSEFGGNVYKNLKETLDVLSQNYKLAIVSNCADGYIESFLHSSKLENYFIDYMAAAKYKVTKAVAIRQVIERNSINSAIYVGDTINDYKATIGAEVDFIQAKYGFGEDLCTEYSIEDISELPKLLDEIQYVSVL